MPGSQASTIVESSTDGYPPMNAASPLTRPEKALTAASSSATSRSPITVGSINLRSLVGGTDGDSQRGSNPSHRRTTQNDTSIASGAGLREVSRDLLPHDAAGKLPSTGSIAWGNAPDDAHNGTAGVAVGAVTAVAIVKDPASYAPLDRQQQQSAATAPGAAISYAGVGGVSSAPAAIKSSLMQHLNIGAAPPGGVDVEDEVESLVQGIDWSVTTRQAAAAAANGGGGSAALGRNMSRSVSHGRGSNTYVPSPLGSRSGLPPDAEPTATATVTGGRGSSSTGSAVASGMGPRVMSRHLSRAISRHTSGNGRGRASASVVDEDDLALEGAGSHGGGGAAGLPGSTGGIALHDGAAGRGAYPARGAFSPANVLAAPPPAATAGAGAWGGMLVDIESGPAMSGMMAAATEPALSSRAARAQAMLARNISRHAVVAVDA
ncbi:hypothetical protein GPECTOR_62g916 [Gonium pectorale]|uniref:Uncharacterized protein n=1 Tax=Gonium pectorale TaxID=33097 RepID=A0A150G4Q3_GONPE|nr:hypothetical protein GPECTOR_62g916 [Gonium pectorale]|eukprot:KXZ44801.1 hypothetical protein GPECTOR_62g916 [Gonium pectorale]